MLGSGLPETLPHVEHRADRAAGAGEHRVGRDDGDAQVAAGQRRAGVEAEPAEREDERAGERHRDVVAGHWQRFAGLRGLADARTDDDRARERRDAADQVDDRGSGEVDVPVAEAEIRAQRARASRRPRPSCAKIG